MANRVPEPIWALPPSPKLKDNSAPPEQMSDQDNVPRTPISTGWGWKFGRKLEPPLQIPEVSPATPARVAERTRSVGSVLEEEYVEYTTSSPRSPMTVPPAETPFSTDISPRNSRRSSFTEEIPILSRPISRHSIYVAVNQGQGASATKKVDHSSRFYFEDGSVEIFVQDTLYNLHRSVLSLHSRFFKDQFKGTVDSYHPFAVDAQRQDFERLLEFIYFSCLWDTIDYTTDEWIGLLSISAQLECAAIRKAAVRYLSGPGHLSMSTQILYGRKYRVPEWYPGLYQRLCERDESLSLGEGEELGMEDVVKIARTREMLAKGYSWSDFEELFE